MSTIEPRIHGNAHADPALTMAMRAARWRSLCRGLRDARASLLDAERRQPHSFELTADMKMLVRLFERRCEKARREFVAVTCARRVLLRRTRDDGVERI